jgi:tRNA-splicing ligase RtcB
MSERGYDVMSVEGGRPVKMWTRGVPVEDGARAQLANTARMPFVHSHVAVMPDVHVGIGATVGSVVATRGAIIPAAVGVDIGCGMMGVQTTLRAADLPDSLRALRSGIEGAVPHGLVTDRDVAHKGSWREAPLSVEERWKGLAAGLERIVARRPEVATRRPHTQLGTLGGGNHFVELCLDADGAVWVMLHSGSRGIGNRIGQVYIELARQDMERHFIQLPDRDLAYLVEGTEHFEAYIEAMSWAQAYAAENRRAMMDSILAVLRKSLPPFSMGAVAVNCHHNYVSRETHFGAEAWVTRKGAVRAGRGELGIIPGSMGARSYIVRGLGNPESFESCSHGAGRRRWAWSAGRMPR